MKFLKQFGIIICISLIGEVLHYIIPFPIPASIYGIVILFLLLEAKLLPLDSIKETGKFLIEIMPVMFIPAAVGLLDSWSIIRSSFISYILITIISTILVMCISGFVTQLMVRKSMKGGSK